MITLRDISYNFFYVLFKKKWLFIIASLVVASSVLLYAYLTTPVHRINSLVLVHQNPKQQLILFRDINTPAQTSQRVHPVYNLKEVVTSRNLSELLVAKHQLDVRARKKMTTPEGLRDIINAYIADAIDLPFLILDFLGILEMGPKDYANKAVEELMYDQIEVGVLAETEVLIINVYDEDPQMALAISKTIIEELANKTVDMEAQKSSQAYLFAKEHVEKEHKKLKDMEDCYLYFKEKQMTVDLEKERKLLLARLDGLKGEAMEIERDQALRSAELAEVEALLMSEKPKPSLKEFAGDKVHSPTEKDSTKGLVRLEPAWKQSYVDLKNKASELRIMINGRSEQLKELRGQIKEVQARLAAIPKKEIELHRLKRALDNQEQLYQGLKEKMNEFEIQRMSDRTEFDIKVINAPSLPQYPESEWPPWDLFALIAMVGGLFFGGILVFIVEQFTGEVSNKSQLEDLVKARILGSIPDLP